MLAEDVEVPNLPRLWRALRHLEPLEHTAFLDLGSGVGWAARLALSRGHARLATALDFARRPLIIGRRLTPEARWVCGDGTALPAEAQVAPGFGVAVADYDGDGHDDVFIAQNFFATPIDTPRLDGGRGLWMKGDGKGNLTAVPEQVSGIKGYGEARGTALVNDYIAHRYHSPQDQATPDWDMSGATQDLNVLYNVGRGLSEGSSWPAWRPNSEFRAARQASHPAP